MRLLDNYFKIQKEVHEYFGYTEDWVAIPLEDDTEYYWKIKGSETEGEIIYATEAIDCEEETGEHYSATIYTQRFLPKWVYRGEDFTMICIDTHVDGNRFLGVFDNKKEL